MTRPLSLRPSHRQERVGGSVSLVNGCTAWRLGTSSSVRTCSRFPRPEPGEVEPLAEHFGCKTVTLRAGLHSQIGMFWTEGLPRRGAEEALLRLGARRGSPIRPPPILGHKAQLGCPASHRNGVHSAATGQRPWTRVGPLLNLNSAFQPAVALICKDDSRTSEILLLRTPQM